MKFSFSILKFMGKQKKNSNSSALTNKNKGSINYSGKIQYSPKKKYNSMSSRFFFFFFFFRVLIYGIRF